MLELHQLYYKSFAGRMDSFCDAIIQVKRLDPLRLELGTQTEVALSPNIL